MNQPQPQNQQIAIEDVFPVVRQRCTELFDENLLLRGQVAGLQRELAAARADSERIERAGGLPFPSSDGPDLAAQPPYQSEDDRG